jgi:hypothetical protein
LLIKFILNGKSYTCEAPQVVVMTDDGRPVALSYEVTGGQAIVHSDARDTDFEAVLKSLGIVERPGRVVRAE